MTAAARCAWKFKKCGRIVEKTQINFRQAEHTFDIRIVRFVDKYRKTLLYLAILQLDNHKTVKSARRSSFICFYCH